MQYLDDNNDQHKLFTYFLLQYKYNFNYCSIKDICHESTCDTR